MENYWQKMDSKWLKEFLRIKDEGLDRDSRKASKAIIEQLNEPEILDVGCGAGVERENYGTLNKVFKYTGVDFTPKMLEICKKMFPDSNFVQASADALPFEGDNFDIVVVRHLLEHIEGGYENVMKEVFKVSKHLILVDFFIVPKDIKEDNLKIAEEGVPLNTYSKQKWLKFIKQNGYKYVSIKTGKGYFNDEIYLITKKDDLDHIIKIMENAAAKSNGKCLSHS